MALGWMNDFSSGRKMTKYESLIPMPSHSQFLTCDIQNTIPKKAFLEAVGIEPTHHRLRRRGLQPPLCTAQKVNWLSARR